MTAFALPVTLTGQHVHLVPLAHGHHDDLVQAVRDGELHEDTTHAGGRP